MPITIADAVEDAVYNTSITFRDHADEQGRKVSRLANVGDAGNLAAAMNVVAAVSHAGIVKATASQLVVVDLDAEPNITLSGLYTLTKQRLILGFQRAHPLNAAKIVTAGFGIPAPINTIVSSTNPKRPLYTRGTAFASASTDILKLGALIDWLETALTYEAVDGIVYVGGWTFVDSRSGLASVAGVIDGDIRT
jgi:hypothetical protein